MITRALPGVVGFFGLVLSLAAQPVRVSDGLAPLPLASDGIAGGDSVFATADVSLGQSFPGFLSLALADDGAFSFPGRFGWMEAGPAFLPEFSPALPRRVRSAGARAVAWVDVDPEVSEGLSDRSRLIYTGGEVGFLYGKYTGKGGGDIKSGYFIGEVGNEHFRLSVGASYLEDSGGPRYRRNR